MSVNLQKGQKVELRKSNGGSLHRVMVGLGWDEVQQSRGFFAPKPQDIDCDASAFICVNGRLQGTDDVVYFGNLTHRSGCVRHMGDNLTGAGDGDDEQIMIDLASLPTQYDKIIVVVNIYQAMQRRQHFGLIRNAFIRVCDAETNQELCKYNLSENYDNMTAMVFGEVYRYNGAWKFNAIGQATQDNSIGDLAKRFV
ncbi:MAG: TerD family protein [Hungatella sp.]|jgi:stress response protein SCP2|nr:TerD family protein [Hungatella sp.]MCI9502026.1 TerD family protein [Hungatella sp.]MCI9635382.1 TerD family protein [Hungatella sp.]